MSFLASPRVMLINTLWLDALFAKILLPKAVLGKFSIIALGTLPCKALFQELSIVALDMLLLKALFGGMPEVLVLARVRVFLRWAY